MEPATYRCGDLLIDGLNRRITRRGEPVVLERKVFEVILRLLARPDELTTREQLLDSVWGHRFVTPSTLNRAIALARKALAGESEGPPFIQTVHGSGYRYTGPVERLRNVVVEPLARFAPPLAARVPTRLEEIIGRETEIEQIGVMLDSHRAVTLLGAGGMGKTECALEFARRAAARYTDGVWLSDLAPLQRPLEWLENLAHSLSISPNDPLDLLTEVGSLLSGRRALLLLDNCDRISAGVGEWVVELLRRTETLQVLATSQQPLNFVGEHVLRIPPLGLPGEDVAVAADTLEYIASAPAVALLLTRIRAFQRDFTLTVDNAGPIVEICRRLDGMPLALELAAARFALLAPDQVLARLEHRFRFLVDDAAGRDGRHQTLAALIDWSYALLSTDEQRLLRWLSVFNPGWTVEVAADLSPAMALDPDRLIDLLSGLVKKSLVVVDPTLYSPRYRLLESVRSFALDSLIDCGEETLARDAHLKCMRRLASRVHTDLLSGRMRERVAQLIVEHPNIDASIAWARQSGHREDALEIAGSLMLYFKSHGAYIAGRAWCDAALAGTDDLRTPARARALLARGIAELHLKAADLAVNPWLEKAWELARSGGDSWALACASGFRALTLASSGQGHAAIEFVEMTQVLAREFSDEWLTGLAGLGRGWIHIEHGEFQPAIDALRAVRTSGHDLHQRHFIDMYIGLAHFGLGQLQPAATLWSDSLRNALRVSNVRGAAGSVEGCGYIAARRDDPGQALRFLSVAAATRRLTQVPLFRFWLPFHDAALAQVRQSLDPRAIARIVADGEAARQEDIANEAFAGLSAYAQGR